MAMHCSPGPLFLMSTLDHVKNWREGENSDILAAGKLVSLIFLRIQHVYIVGVDAVKSSRGLAERNRLSFWFCDV